MSMTDQMRSWQPSTVLTFWAIAVGAWATAAVALGVRAWSWATHTPAPANPARVAALIVRGGLEPTAGMWAWVGMAALVLAAAPVVVVRLVRHGRAARRRGDEAARLTGRRGDTESLNEKAVRAKAERLGAGTSSSQNGSFGLPIGRAVADGRRLWTSFEDVCIMIAGPRTGKTTCWVVPRIWAAPGFVLATSNKPDVLEATRRVRARRGDVWVFDPQGIADEPQSWWWNILSYVTDAVQARALTQIFIDTTRDAKAQTSAYFDSAARDLVTALVLAAARGERTIMEVHGWLADQTNREPLIILRRAGEDLMAQSLEGTMNLVAETRSGVYGTASTMVSFMLNTKAMRWVTPQPLLAELRPDELVTSTDTLYCLSQEGRGDASPIVTALTVAVTETAVAHARTQADGRLRVPMLIELDEAANVCRWRELPNMYSHFGSRGIVVDTILQAWAQGVSGWGEEGIKKLWSAANQKVYGGGVSERGFLSDLEAIIGTHWVDSVQTTSSRQGSSTSRSRNAQQRQIATVKDLAELPPGRAWVLSSGNKAVLTEMVPYWNQDRVDDTGQGTSSNSRTATAAITTGPQPTKK